MLRHRLLPLLLLLSLSLTMWSLSVCNAQEPTTQTAVTAAEKPPAPTPEEKNPAPAPVPVVAAENPAPATPEAKSATPEEKPATPETKSTTGEKPASADKKTPETAKAPGDKTAAVISGTDYKAFWYSSDVGIVERFGNTQTPTGTGGGGLTYSSYSGGDEEGGAAPRVMPTPKPTPKKEKKEGLPAKKEGAIVATIKYAANLLPASHYTGNTGTAGTAGTAGGTETWEPITGCEVTVEQISGAEYEERKRREISGKWMPRFTAFIQGQTSIAEADEEDPIPKGIAESMVNLDQTTRQRLQQNPVYLEELSRQMAEWTFFWRQFTLYTKFAQQTLDGEYSEVLVADPAAAETQVSTFWSSLKTKSEARSKDQKKDYDTMAKNVQTDTANQTSYEEWLKDQNKELVEYAQKWGRRYDGTEMKIGPTLYMVRNVKEKPANPEDDAFKQYLPSNAVLIEVPKEKLVTPYDLINSNGTLKKAAE